MRLPEIRQKGDGLSHRTEASQGPPYSPNVWGLRRERLARLGEGLRRTQEQMRRQLGAGPGEIQSERNQVSSRTMRFLYAARMHARTRAISHNILAVSIANRGKFVGVTKTRGVESLVADPREMMEEAVINDQAFGQKAGLRKQLEHRMPQLREMVLSLFGEQSTVES